MNIVWLQPRPHPDRPTEVHLLDAASIRGLRVQPLPWTETRRGQEHTWALHALVSGQRAPVEVVRGEHQNVGQTVAADLARILATEKAHFDRQGLGVIVRCQEETPHGVVFDVERTHRPQNNEEWWPREYRDQVRRAERGSRSSLTRRFNPVTGELKPDNPLVAADHHAKSP